jgi:hypothetical protein
MEVVMFLSVSVVESKMVLSFPRREQRIEARRLLASVRRVEVAPSERGVYGHEARRVADELFTLGVDVSDQYRYFRCITWR